MSFCSSSCAAIDQSKCNIILVAAISLILTEVICQDDLERIGEILNAIGDMLVVAAPNGCQCKRNNVNNIF